MRHARKSRKGRAKLLPTDLSVERLAVGMLGKVTRLDPKVCLNPYNFLHSLGLHMEPPGSSGERAVVWLALQ